jgi:PAS domain S-box-containing protein
MFDLPLATVEEIECQVHSDIYGRRRWPDHPTQGCPGCLYRVKWTPAPRLRFWKRWYQRHRIYPQAIEDLVQAHQQIQLKYEEARQLAEHLESTNEALQASKQALEAKQSELMASEQLYRLLAENVRDIIWTFNLSTMSFDYVSPSVEKCRGFTPEQAMALSLEQTLAPQSLKHVQDAIAEELARDGQPGVDPQRSRTIELEHSTSKGNYIWTEVTVGFIRDQAGQPVGLLGVSRDIAKRKQAEIELAQSEQKAKQFEAHLQRAQKMEALGTLAGGIAHDFNNILSGIIGYAELCLADTDDQSPIHHQLEEIHHAGIRARDLVKQILAFSRKSGIQLKPMKLDLLLREVLKLMRPSLPAGVSLYENIDDHVSSIMAEPTQIHQILMNLCTNAVQAMETSGGMLHVRLEQVELGGKDMPLPLDLRPGLYVRLTVADTGCGMSEEIVGQIFDPYFTTKETGKGTGLGLSVVHGIVKSCGGAITVQSKPGRGAVFDVCFPAVGGCEDQDLAIPGPVPRGSERVLLVDDEQTVLELQKTVLERLGYTVTVCDNGLDALEKIRRNPDGYDLVISDMTMPVMTGDQLASEVMKIQKELSIILCTGFSRRLQKLEIDKLGVRAVVMKPFSGRELASTVRQVLDKN